MKASGLFSNATILAFFLILFNVRTVTSVDNLEVVYQWKILEYNWPDEETQLLFSHYIQENNNPLGLEVAGDRLFITVPRWKAGVAATLNYVYLNDTSESPVLNPYPSFESHRFDGDNIPDVVSVFRVWADNCDRLWVLDTGMEDMLGTINRTQAAPPALLIYDLSTDQLLRKYVIPTEQTVSTSHFGNVVVEDSSCDETFAYLADIANPGLVVYSWASNDSWLVTHHYFNADPLSGNFNVSGLSFQWWDGVINLGLALQEDGYSTLYFHPLCSNAEFSVSTELLQDPELATASASFNNFTYLGSRGTEGQGAASYLDPSSGILFHATFMTKSVSCWNPVKSYDTENVGIVQSDDTTLDFPSDIKVNNGSIWVLSDRLPIYMYGELDSDDYNYRVLSGTVEEAVAGTVCSSGTSTCQITGLLSILLVIVFAYDHGGIKLF